MRAAGTRDVSETEDTGVSAADTQLVSVSSSQVLYGTFMNAVRKLDPDEDDRTALVREFEAN